MVDAAEVVVRRGHMADKIGASKISHEKQLSKGNTVITKLAEAATESAGKAEVVMDGGGGRRGQI